MSICGQPTEFWRPAVSASEYYRAVISIHGTGRPVGPLELSRYERQKAREFLDVDPGCRAALRKWRTAADLLGRSLTVIFVRIDIDHAGVNDLVVTLPSRRSLVVPGRFAGFGWDHKPVAQAPAEIGSNGPPKGRH
jgi:hypothetical protein